MGLWGANEPEEGVALGRKLSRVPDLSVFILLRRASFRCLK